VVRRRPAGGFTLLEVLVAVFVLAVGVLGAAATQLAALRTRHQSSLMSNGVQLASALADGMRANLVPMRAVDTANPYPQLDYDAASDGPPPSGPVLCGRGCAATESANADVHQLKQALYAGFPGGRVVVCRDSQASTLAAARCAGLRRRTAGATVTWLGWRGKEHDGSAAHDRAGEFAPAWRPPLPSAASDRTPPRRRHHRRADGRQRDRHDRNAAGGRPAGVGQRRLCRTGRGFGARRRRPLRARDHLPRGAPGGVRRLGARRGRPRRRYAGAHRRPRCAHPAPGGRRISDPLADATTAATCWRCATPAPAPRKAATAARSTALASAGAEDGWHFYVGRSTRGEPNCQNIAARTAGARTRRSPASIRSSPVGVDTDDPGDGG
jgi:type IV pilus assembly protein PilV